MNAVTCAQKKAARAVLSFLLDGCGEICGTAYTLGGRQKPGVEVVEMQDRQIDDIILAICGQR